jgi:S1-C subfamily serine protease
MVVDADGRLLGMTSTSPGGDTVVVPHGVIARFLGATSSVLPKQDGAMPMLQTMALPTAPSIPQVAVVVGDQMTRSNPSPERGPGGGVQVSGNHLRGWLGVSLQPITVPDNLAHRAGQRTARQVVSITRGGPADRAGLRSGDVLLALDGSSTTGNHALRAFLAPERIGSEVEVRLMRDGLIHTTILTVAAQPEP